MRQSLGRWFPSAVAGLVVIGLAGSADTAARQSLPRVRAIDLVYEGAFRVPLLHDRQSYDFGGTALAMVGSRRTIALVGHDHNQLIGEISVPDPGRAQTVAGLPTAASTIAPRDLLRGLIDSVAPGSNNAKKVGGLLAMPDGSWFVSAYDYYDAGRLQTRSHFRVGADGSVTGPFRIGSIEAGFAAGWIVPVPTEWRSALGTAALTGQCCIPVVSRTSSGPALMEFDPAAAANQPAARLLLGYPVEHPTLGSWERPGALFNGATTITGAVFPNGTGSVLFFGTYGTRFCYGAGTPDPNLHGKPTPEGSVWCHDPTSPYNGAHGYPYVSRVWAYAVEDLIAVRNGTRSPWDVVPYATWPLDLPFQNDSRSITGATYDPVTKRVFVASGRTDGDRPLVHVFNVATTAVDPGCAYAVWHGAQTVSDGSTMRLSRARTQVVLTVEATPASCAWSARSTSDWLKVSNSGDGRSLSVTAEANLVSQPREAALLVADRAVYISQAGLTSGAPITRPEPRQP